jgi:hypothetical protein
MELRIDPYAGPLRALIIRRCAKMEKRRPSLAGRSVFRRKMHQPQKGRDDCALPPL